MYHNQGVDKETDDNNVCGHRYCQSTKGSTEGIHILSMTDTHLYHYDHL